MYVCVSTIEVAFINRFISYFVHEIFVDVAQNRKLIAKIENSSNGFISVFRPITRVLVQKLPLKMLN